MDYPLRGLLSASGRRHSAQPAPYGARYACFVALYRTPGPLLSTTGRSRKRNQMCLKGSRAPSFFELLDDQRNESRRSVFSDVCRTSFRCFKVTDEQTMPLTRMPVDRQSLDSTRSPANREGRGHLPRCLADDPSALTRRERYVFVIRSASTAACPSGPLVE